MTTWRLAAVLSVTLAVASCSGTNYQSAPANEYGYESGGFDSNWIWAGIALALIFAVSSAD
jgi:uncharacterized membrane protein YphA (DoxX/SURF4 family)